MNDLKGTAQVKNIKPGVLSKIMNISGKNSNELLDENIKKLIISTKELEESLLDYAKLKPTKIQFTEQTEKNHDITNFEQVKTNKYNQMIDKIFEFK